eukprot:CAMPEP_0117465106 /NCGR_PEP_ID=MMETSP0784-20121206/4455_1 /TAXON_ID=39447 /ORGANISM="" /LENGTH=727 /DNA_ID=CAMNT_0005259005 /DNA_START=362 /DNA_END=2543 /DNA_ORIENTATION=+
MSLGCQESELRIAAKALELPRLEAWCLQQGCITGRDCNSHGTIGHCPGRARVHGKLQVDQRPLVACSAGLTLLALGAWWPSLSYKIDNNGFFMDDAMIAKNANVVEAINWQRLLRTDFWGLDMFDGSWTHKSFRPLTVLTFRFNYWLHGFDSSGFHATNLLLHLVASGLLGIFSKTVLDLPAAWALLLTALFFAHPVHTENVLYIVGRADLLCCAVVLLASLCYGPSLVGRASSAIMVMRTLLAVGLSGVAGLCKETGFCFFGLFIGQEVLHSLLVHSPHGDTKWRWQRAWQRSARIVTVLLLGGLLCYWRHWYTGGTKIKRMDPHSNPVAAEPNSIVRFLSYALIHGLYAKLLVWPTFLCYDYSFDAVPLVRTFCDVRLLLPLSGYLAFAELLYCAMRALRPPSHTSAGARVAAEKSARTAPIVGLAILVLSFLPMSNIFFPVGTVIGERLLYVPSAGLLVTVVGLAHLVDVEQRSSCRHIPVMLLLFMGFAGIVLCARRVLDWSSPEAITVADGMKQPRSTRVQFNLANAQLQARRYDDALATYQRAITIDPQDHDSMPLYHAGQILFYQGRHDEAERYLARAVAGYFSPLIIKEEEIWHDYALILWFAQKVNASVKNFENALTINPMFTKAWNNLGCAQGLGALLGILPRGFLHQGIQSLHNALKLDPGSILYWRNVAALLHLSGDDNAAVVAMQQLQAAYHQRPMALRLVTAAGSSTSASVVI